jgi:hypothetical protein
MTRRLDCRDCTQQGAACSPEHDTTARDTARLAETRKHWPTPGTSSPWDVPTTTDFPRTEPF